jgi:hypothetical protein
MNVRVFKGREMAWLSETFASNSTFLTAVDLHSGREKVFSAEVLADLTSTGCKSLFYQKVGEQSRIAALPLALAVAASSAVPPWFRPVAVHEESHFLGAYVDGGVVDNNALNVPRNFSLYINDEPAGTVLLSPAGLSSGPLANVQGWCWSSTPAPRSLTIFGSGGVDVAACSGYST